MKIIYILSLTDKNYEYKKFNSKFFNYEPEIKYSVKRLSALESLEKSIRYLRKFYEDEILLISDFKPKFLKKYEISFKELDLDPSLKRIELFIENIDDFGVFIEHDVTIFEKFEFKESFTNAWNSCRPGEFCGDFFGLEKDKIQFFYNSYLKIQNYNFISKIQNCVYGTFLAFNTINAKMYYNIITQPDFDTIIPKDFIGIHSHYDLYPKDLKC